MFKGQVELKEDQTLVANYNYEMSAERSYVDKMIAEYESFKKYIDALPEGAEKDKQMKAYAEGMNFYSKLADKGMSCDGKTTGTFVTNGDQITTKILTNQNTCTSHSDIETKTSKFEVNSDELKLYNKLSESELSSCPSGDSSVKLHSNQVTLY